MYSKTEADVLARDVGRFIHVEKSYNETVTGLVASHNKLINDYKSLMNDYEEAKEARDRWKQEARGTSAVRTSGGAPCVAVIIDGDNYFFNDRFIRDDVEGGRTAANFLNKLVRDRLRLLGLPAETKIVVRHFCNLKKISSLAHRSGLIGSHTRSMANMTASFSTTFAGFESVDVGEGSGAVAAKVADNMDVYSRMPDCRHIFFAACVTQAYFKVIGPFARMHERISLIETPKCLSDFTNLGLNCIAWPELFKDSPITPNSNKAETSKSPLLVSDHSSESKDESSSSSYKPSKATKWPKDAVVCTHFQRGICKYGKTCNKRHENAKSPINSSKWATARSPAVEEQKPWYPRVDPTTLATYLSSMKTSYRDDHGYNHEDTHSLVPSEVLHSKHTSRYLPERSATTINQIPVNGSGHRLDFYPGPFDETLELKIPGRPTPCRDFHLKIGGCHDGRLCKFDHGYIEPSFKIAMFHDLHNKQACPRGGSCRQRDCLLAHICYKDDCVNGIHHPSCKLPTELHKVDPRVDGWANATIKWDGPREEPQSPTSDLLGTPPPPPRDVSISPKPLSTSTPTPMPAPTAMSKGPFAFTFGKHAGSGAAPFVNVDKFNPEDWKAF